MKKQFLEKRSEQKSSSGRNLSMKILPWVVCCMLINLHSFGFPQNKKMSVQFKNATVEEVVSNLESLIGYTFVYSDLDKAGVTITADVEGENPEAVLEQVFKNSSLSFEILNDNVIVLRKATQKTNLQTPQSPKMVQFKGRVIDNNQEPIIGANVIITGTTIGIATDENGQFTLHIPEKTKSITITYIGYETQVINLTPEMLKTDANIFTLQESTSFIDEVVVQGYGVQKVKDATGAVSRMNEKDIAMAPMGASIQSLLQGRAPGVNVTIQSASPTSPVNVVIRGVSTLTGNTQPL